MIVLDTNVLSELIRQEPNETVMSWIDSLEAETVATTAVTAAELLYGVARLPAGKRKDRLSESVHALLEEDLGDRVQPFDRAAATHYSELVSAQEQKGQPISVADAQIAAICRKLGATLATRNTRDFNDTGIDVIDPWRP